ncbi:electron transport complex subunit E [Ferriphaselus sp. R-1]|uniref:electron transport complex subunit E n=1 Tax=Ferriphaselus sp. R-1 TaxID=1485544 RepID=UPI000552D592|nr:electron transport complex subunit E [Ferriphaselus sp. R-1]
MSAYKDILYNGIWKQNTGLVQLLGLCPLLAVSSTLVNGVSLGLATALVMTLSGAAVSPIRNYIPNEIRIPVYILIVAVLVTVVQYLMNAYMYGLYVVLGIFIPLIVTNCIVLARVEAFAAKNPVGHAALDGFAMGLGLTLVLGVLGALREVIGKGTLFSGIDLALGDWAHGWVLHVIPDYKGFLVAILPPGAFIGLAFLIAAKNWHSLRTARKAQGADATVAPVEGGCSPTAH